MKPQVTRELVKEFLNYNELTGVFTWLPRDRKYFASEHSFKVWNTRFSGKTAGSICLDSSGYQFLNIGILGRLYKAHRLAWLYVTGDPAPKEIDHKNQNALDNSWGNLRDGTGKNARNHSLQRSNTSGFTGVSWPKGKARGWPELARNI